MDEHSDIEIVEDATLADPREYLADVSTRLVSGVLGLMGFSTAILVGILAGNPGIVILLRAMLAMLICAVIGRVLGAMGEVCVREYVTHYKSNRPVPAMPDELIELEKRLEDHGKVIDNMKKAA